ncbi:unnamed protein product [Rhizoctonia solani]|nr:unnamed protein product [Rhizoctonia solani]
MTAEMEQMNYHSRMHAFEEILDSSSALRVVDIPQLRVLSMQGIPEHPVWMRSRIWRLLLGALPPEKEKWENMANKSRMRYYDVAAQLLEPIQTAPPPDYPLNARDKLLDTIAKDVDRTQPRIPFFRHPIDPLQTWPKPTPTTSNSDAEPEPPKADVADAIFDRLTIVQRVVRFGNSAPPPAPRTPEIRVMEVAPPSTNENDNDETHGSNSDENTTNANSKANPDESEDSDDKPLAFKAGGRSSLGLNLNGLSPHVSPRPPTLQLNGHSEPDEDEPEAKTHAHILLRILFVYSLLHPHHPYTQGLNELLAPLYFTVFEGRSAGLRSYGFGVRREEMVGEAAIRAEGQVVAQADGEHSASSTEIVKANVPEDEEDDPTQHIEADTFWLFVELMGELGSIVGDPGDWSLPPVVSGSGEGVRGVMARMSDRLKWADARLWEDMVKKSLDPKLPYFSYRWVACLLAQDLPLAALLPTWDTLFSQDPSTPETNPKIEFIINLCVALLLGVRDKLIRAGNKRGGVGLWGEEEEEDDDVPLSMIQSQPTSPTGLPMNEAFVQGMLLLQRYPLESVGLGWVINKAFELGAKRAAGFGIIEQNNAGGAGWGSGAWDVAAAMRSRVTGWRSVSGESASTPAPTLAPAPEAAASTIPVPAVLVSPPGAPSLAAVGGKLRQYTESFKQSDTAATLSKASTNWSLAVMTAWNRTGTQQPPQPSEAPSPPPKESTRGHGRSGSWAGWGATAMAAAKLRAAAMAKPREANIPESVAEEPSEEQQSHSRRGSRQWEPLDRERQPGDRSQSLSPTALTKVMATTQPFVPQSRTTTDPHQPLSTPRSAQDPPSDYEPPPRPAVFKNPRDSWLPTPKRTDTHDTQDEDAPPVPVPSPGHRFTMTLPGWSAVPPPASPSQSSTKKKTVGPKPLLLGKSRQTTTNTTRFSRMSRQSSISSSTGSHREWELMTSLSPRSDSGSMIGRPDSGSYAGRSRRSMGTGSMPASAAGSLAPSEDEAVVVGLGLTNASSEQGSPPLVIPRERPTSREMKRTSSPLSVSVGAGSDSSKGWQLTDGPATAEPTPARKWELSDGPADTKSKAETLPTHLDTNAVPATMRRYELTDGPAPSKATSLGVASVLHESPAESPVAPPPRKWELSDNPMPRINPQAPALTADSDAADSPVLAPGEIRKGWPKRSSSHRPVNLNIRTKSRPLSTATITPSGDNLRTPLVETDMVTPTSANSLTYLGTPSPGATETPLPQTEERTPRRKKQSQSDRKSKAGRGAPHTPEVMSEEDGVKADAEDGEEFDEFLSSYETETDDPAGQAR